MKKPIQGGRYHLAGICTGTPLQPAVGAGIATTRKESWLAAMVRRVR